MTERTNDNLLQQIVIVFLMMVFAFCVQELPNSNVLQIILPEWPYLLILYFSVSTRYFFGVISAFCMGIIQDVFLGIPTLGLHAGIYVLCSSILIIGRLRFVRLGIPTQSLIVGVLVFIKIFFVSIYGGIFYSIPSHFWSVLSIPFSIISWPGVYIFFQFFADKHK